MDSLVMWMMRGMLQSKLQQMGIPTQWVNFRNFEEVNQFAQQILPQLLKNNPQAKEMIKNNMGDFLSKEQKEEIVKIVDSF
jgi:hypothetical protein